MKLKQTIKYCHFKNFIAIDRLSLLINIMFIIMLILTYACFLIFLSVYYNVILTTIKKDGGGGR